MDYLLSSFNSIGDIMLSGIVSSAVDREIDSRTSQTQGTNRRSWRGLLDTTLCNEVYK